MNLIIPGERVGFINKNTTEGELKQLLPVNQTKRVLYYMGEGVYACATEIFPDSDSSAVIIWKNSDSFKLFDDTIQLQKNETECKEKPLFMSPISVKIKGGNWHTENGVKIGLSLTELEKTTGSSVLFDDCACDTDGMVYDPNPHLHIRLDTNNGQDFRVFPRVAKSIQSEKLPENVKNNIRVQNISVNLDAAGLDTKDVKKYE